MSPMNRAAVLKNTGIKDSQGMTLYEVYESITYTMEILPPVEGERDEDYSAFPLILTVKPGYRTNLASVPRFLWWIFPPMGDTDAAAIIHDLLCEKCILPRHISDTIFRQIMKETNVPFLKRTCMYYGVRLGAVYNLIRDRCTTSSNKRSEDKSTSDDPQ